MSIVGVFEDIFYLWLDSWLSHVHVNNYRGKRNCVHCM